MPSVKDFVLDAEAEKLYQMLGGIDTSSHLIAPAEYDTDGFIDSIVREEEIVEAARVLLVEAAHYLAAFFTVAQNLGPEELCRERIEKVMAAVDRLAEIPGRESNLVLRFRGNSARGEEPDYAQFNYSMTLGNYSIDLSIAKSLGNHKATGVPDLAVRLRKAFKSFGRLDISSVCLTIGVWGAEDRKRVRVSLQGLAVYYQNLADTANAAEKVVYNENRQPDPNLTVLGLINRVTFASLRQLVGQVKAMMYCDKPSVGLLQCVSVYDAIFVFKKFRDQLQKPAVEVNNTRWLMVNGSQDVISRDRAEICHALAKVFDNSPRRIAEIIESVYGSDYRDIGVDNLSGNLRKLTDFFLRLEQETALAATKGTILRIVSGCLGRVADEILDEFLLPARNLLHSEIFGLVAFFKQRVATSRKVRRIISEPIVFSAQDLEILARDLGIGSEEARQLILSLQECFTIDSHFNRRNFENNIEVFLKSEKKVFAFLWHYLKEIRDRNDRVTFLSSLQMLISKMQRPQNALDILLRDVVGDPEAVRFSDRNALILANLLIRKYNKELHKQIELTPEEVMLVKDGLNLEMTVEAETYIDQEADRFFRKTKTLHKAILDALSGKKGANDKPMPLHYVISVEREAFMLLSLIGGRIPHKIIQSAVKEYGDPDSKVYTLVADQGQMKVVLGLLQLAVRGLGRFKTDTDLKLLQEVRCRKEEFQTRYGELLPEGMLDKVMGFVDASMTKILADT